MVSYKAGLLQAGSDLVNNNTDLAAVDYKHLGVL
jgi:hypothetical protein